MMSTFNKIASIAYNQLHQKDPEVDYGKILADGHKNGTIGDCFGNVYSIKPKMINSRQICLDDIFSPKKPKSKIDIKDVVINNRGINADFSIAGIKVSIDKNTGAVSYGNKDDKLGSYSKRTDLPKEMQTEFGEGNPITIVMRKHQPELSLTLYPDASGNRVIKAEVTWSGNGPLTPRQQMETIMRAKIENKVTVENILGGGALKITPKKTILPFPDRIFLKNL